MEFFKSPPLLRRGQIWATSVNSDHHHFSKPYSKLRNAIENDPSDLRTWDALFEKLDNDFQQLYVDGDHERVNQEFKELAYESYSALLDRFPYLTSYWKRWSILEFKIKGTKESIEILGKAVDGFPHSLELWIDYLSALITALYLEPDSEKRDFQIKFIRSRYQLALRLNGKNFNSHSLWDKVVKFESDLDENSDRVLEVYLQIIGVPLYEYSRYFKEFSNINKKFAIEKIIPEEELSVYLSNYGKVDLKQTSQNERNHIVDDYSYRIFEETQIAVEEKWKYESSLSIQEFNLTLYNDIVNETENWLSYCSYQILKYRNNPNNESLDLVCNVFERALVPNCLESKVWMCYITFLFFSELSDEEKHKRIKQLYEISTAMFIPLDDLTVRFSYVDFLVNNNESEHGIEYLLDVIKLSSGTQSKDSAMYIKVVYVKSIERLMKVFSSRLQSIQYALRVRNLILEYFDKQNTSLGLETDEVVNSCDHEIEDNYLKALQKLLNDDSILILTDIYMNYLRENIKSPVTQLRAAFNQIFRERPFKNSIRFWRMFINLEREQGSVANVIKLLEYISERTHIPKIVVDSLIDECYTIASANLSNTPIEIGAFMLMKDSWKSNSLTINIPLKRKLANNSSQKQENEDFKKFSNSSKVLKIGKQKEDHLLSVARRHLDHPGIFVEAIPEITNTLIGKEPTISRNSTDIAPLPTFKNVEKASLPINYPNLKY